MFCDLLARVELQEINSEWHLRLPKELSRTEYVKFAELLKRFRGEWRRKDNAHVFPFNPTKYFERYISEGYIPPVNPYAFFPTPITVVDRMIEIAMTACSPEERISFLEPSAGNGIIAEAIIDKFPEATVDCIEIDQINQQIIQDKKLNLVYDDFETFSTEHKYDCILMNPPFQGNRYQLHIQKAFELLKPNRHLVSVVPNNFRFETRRKFRNWVFENGETEDIGRPFKRTSIDCSILVLNNCSTEHLWNPTEGYDSWYHLLAAIALENDYQFQSLPNITETAIDLAIEEYIKNGKNLIWNDSVRSSIAMDYGLGSTNIA